MRRLRAAVREWLDRRCRVQEEFQFHLERSAAEAEWLGSPRQIARRHASKRFGGRRHLLAARRELGADWRGLLALLVAHGVPASPCFQPTLLLLATVVLLALSPSLRVTVESVLGTPLARADRESVFISRQARNLSFRGLTSKDRKAVQAIPGLQSIAAYGGSHIRARLSPGASLETLRVNLQQYNQELRLLPLFHRNPVVMSPARAVWGFLLLVVLYRVRGALGFTRSTGYLLLGAISHTLAAMVLWAVAMQLWLAVPWRTDGRAALAFTMLLLGYAGAAVRQTCWWLHDVESRCPRCFERLRLPLTTGTGYNTILDPATTESICVYGHGRLREDRWTRRFHATAHHGKGLTHA